MIKLVKYNKHFLIQILIKLLIYSQNYRTQMKDERAFSGKHQNDTILQKLHFRIIEVSSEEEGYPVTELLNHTPFSRGWQSSKFSDYPQEIILEFPSVIRVKQIQFLSHQYKISSKIEISMGVENSENAIKKFKKIGYLGLDANERSNFQARELKSVYVDYTTGRIKVALHRCHTNIHNTFLQVGLIAINILGESFNKGGDNVNMNNFLGEVGTKLEEEMNYDPVTLKRLKNLYKAKEKAIELEDFDEAKKIKEAVERLKSVSQQLIQLEERKRMAIRNDDFDAAKMLKYEVERLRNAVVGIQLTGEVSSNIGGNNYANNKQVTMGKKPMIRDELDEYDEIPMGREKSDKKLLVPINKKGNLPEMPITSDLIMDEDKYKMTKNINPNQGYKLKDRDEIKAKVDVDQQLIKGIDKSFSEIVADKVKKEGGNKTVKEAEEVEEDIPASEYKKAEPLIPVLTFDLVKMMFSKYWRNKEEGIKIISEEIQKHPNSELLSPHGVDKILTAVVGASAYVLSCNISQPIMATMDLLKMLFNKFRGNSIGGYLRQDFDNYIDQCMLLLIEKVGDTNLKLKEKAENTVMEFANSTLVGHKTVFEDLVTGQVKKTLVKSAKHLAGRLNLITRMINNFGLNASEVPIEPLMTYAINAFKDANKDVRDAAFNCIMNVYKFIGDGVKKFFKDLRPNQVNILEEGFENLDGLKALGEEQEEFANESQMIYKGADNVKEKSGGKSQAKSNKPKNNNESNYEEEENQPKVRNDNFTSQQINPSEDPQSCGICGYFDPAYDEDALQMHWFKECPMLSICYKCKQVVEISALDYHLKNECSHKKEFKQCGRCKEMYHQSEYNQHVAEKLCYPAKNPNVANRCPLCHTDHTPAGKVGWEVHLLQNTCTNNPRTSG